MKGLSPFFACEIKGCPISDGSFRLQLFAGIVAAPKGHTFLPLYSSFLP